MKYQLTITISFFNWNLTSFLWDDDVAFTSWERGYIEYNFKRDLKQNFLFIYQIGYFDPKFSYMRWSLVWWPY